MNELAELAYHGRNGATRPCEIAVLEALQGETPIKRVRILTHDAQHGLALFDALDDLIIIKPGFSSGYTGTGPVGFSRALAMLGEHGALIDEIDLSAVQFERLEQSAFTSTDLDLLRNSRCVRVSEYQDYIRKSDWEDARAGKLWSCYPARLPLSLMAPDLLDLVLEFNERPGYAIHQGFVRLEDLLRVKSSLGLSGTRLISGAFSPKDPKLTLIDLADQGEQAGLEHLFRGAFQLHRNRRAHRELKTSRSDAVSEFMLLNHLFRLLEHVEPAADASDEDASDSE